MFAAAWCFLTLTLVAKYCTAICHDLDPQACELMAQQNPSFCSNNGLADAVCPKFCGKCPLECYECSSSVSTFSDCNTTKTCADGEKCMIRELISTRDNHREYKMNCATVDMCDGSSLMVFGRRSVHTRDVNTHCCSTDLCNYPQSALTASPPIKETTPTTVPTTVEQTTIPAVQTTTNNLLSCSKDLEIVIEDSENINAEAYITPFLKSLIASMKIGPLDNQVGVALFSRQVHPEFDLDTYSNNMDLSRAIDNLNFLHSTNFVDIEDVVSFLVTHLHDGRGGDRVNFQDMVLVIADHSTHVRRNIGNSPVDKRRDPEYIDKPVIVINVGFSTHHSAFSHLSSYSNHVINVADFTELQGVLPQLLTLLCQ